MKYSLKMTWIGMALLGLTGCLELEAPRAIGPVVRLSASEVSVDASPGETTALSVQALDVNGVGVSGAWVTFARVDATRLSWPEAPSGADAITVETKPTTVGNVHGDGLAVVSLKIADAASVGDGVVIAVVKGPADDESTLTARITVHVRPTADGGTGDAAPPSAGAAGESNQNDTEGSGGAGS